MNVIVVAMRILIAVIPSQLRSVSTFSLVPLACQAFSSSPNCINFVDLIVLNDFKQSVDISVTWQIFYIYILHNKYTFRKKRIPSSKILTWIYLLCYQKHSWHSRIKLNFLSQGQQDISNLVRNLATSSRNNYTDKERRADIFSNGRTQSSYRRQAGNWSWPRRA